ncbi:MAG: excinuclease ABC subunit UvrC [Myxococcota bacterium]|nr:excinuclease ABC subunit UvrC [Myxococcota bacterium]
MSQDLIDEKSRKIPRSPGVYLFKDREQKVLYVGKAKNLRARVRQYVLGQDQRQHVELMLRRAVDVEVVVAASEKEALLLENTLIKRHRPRYNIQLRDDKNFLHIALNSNHAWPRFTLVRRMEKKRGVRYFGPYASAPQARKTLDFVERKFALRTCTDRTLASRKRPCLLHQIHRCVGPCVEGLTSSEEYQDLLKEAVWFLEGRHQQLLGSLEAKMTQSAQSEDFERAASQRDLIQSIQASLERQQVIDPALADRDIWGLFRDSDAGELVVLQVRRGVMIEPVGFSFKHSLESNEDLLTSSLLQFYSQRQAPREVLLPIPVEEAAALEELLREQSERAVSLSSPQRGRKRRLVDLANQNAQTRFRQAENIETRREEALALLAEHCGLSSPPRRIECYDNSNFQGSSPVASQVLFVDGKPEKSGYRRYHIRSVEGPDDFASMAEVLGRRIRRAWEKDDFPDLIVVDGGKGQLSAAQAVLRELGAEQQPIIGLVKARTEKRRGERSAFDKIVLPGQSEPLRLADSDPALNLLRHLRDESHRFAITFHRKTRQKRSIASEMDQIEGVGPTRKRRLLRHFGSLKRIRQASVEDLQSVEGISEALAMRIAEALGRKSES